MRTLKSILFPGVIALGLASFSGCGTMSPANSEPDAYPLVVAPPWAPPYDDLRMVRYYYLPDLGVYYDVWGHEFVCQQNGNWAFMRSLPPAYAGVDLSTTFVVVLDSRAFEPWTRHQYYIAHYPRYYYHDAYHVSDARDVRGFNENRSAEIRRPGDRRDQLVRAVPQPPVRNTILPIAREERRATPAEPQPPVRNMILPVAREAQKAAPVEPQPPVRNMTLPVAREAQKAASAEPQPPVRNMTLPVARETQKTNPTQPKQHVHATAQKPEKRVKVEPQKARPRDKEHEEK